MAYSVSQNTSIYTAASILQKAVSFVYFTIVARLIGVEGTGQYFFALSFAAIFTVVADFGMAATLTREAARYPENTERYVSTVLWTKILFGLGSYALMIGLSYALGYDAVLKQLIMVAGLTMLFDNLHNVFFGVFRAHRNLLYESIGIVVSQVITMVLGLTALYQQWPLWWLIASYTVSSATVALFAAVMVRRIYQIHFFRRFDRQVFVAFFAMAIPFGLAGILLRLYSYADSIIMSKLLAPEHLGWWSVPYKMTFAFQFLPAALSASIYPVMSSYMVTSKEKIGELFEKAWRYLFLIAFPLMFGLGAVAEPLIVKLYGVTYLPSVSVLRILLISLVFAFLSFVTGATLNATNNQSKQTALLATTLGVNIFLNIMLIPVFETQGAAIAALVGNMMLSLGGFMLVRRVVALRGRLLWLYCWRALWPAAIMGASVYASLRVMPFWAAIPLGVALYGGLLLLSGTLTKEMFQSFRLKLFPVK